MDTVERKIFDNNFNQFDPGCMTDKQRGTYIQMLKIGTAKHQMNNDTTVATCYPKYNRSYQTMSAIDRKEYKRLEKLIKI